MAAAYRPETLYQLAYDDAGTRNGARRHLLPKYRREIAELDAIRLQCAERPEWAEIWAPMVEEQRKIEAAVAFAERQIAEHQQAAH